MKKSHAGKIAVTIFVAALIILYYALYAKLFFDAGADMPLVFGIIFFIIPIAAIICVIYVSIKRIQEIKRGEEDDLDNY